MNKTKKSFFQNKIFGFIATIIFYFLLGFGIFFAATKINYPWKWLDIPRYFFHQDINYEEAPFDGVVKIVENTIILSNKTEDNLELKVPSNGKLLVKDGEEVYENDRLYETLSWKIGPLVKGLILTLEISALGSLFAFSIGALLALMRLSKYPYLQYIATVYITCIRGTPLLVQIFIFYFFIATVFKLSAFFAGALTLGIFFGAYIAEIFRGAIQSIDKGQSEAAKSLGMSYFQTMYLIVIPQAFKRVLPTLVGEVISIVKDSSLVSVIAVTELTKAGKDIASNSFAPFETYVTVALIYFCVTLLLSVIGGKIEQRLKQKGGF